MRHVPTAMRVDAILFDKDGTLFDFHAMWAGWAEMFLNRLAVDTGTDAAQLAEAVGFDPGIRRFRPGSPVIAGTPDEIAAALVAFLPEIPAAILRDRMNAEAALVPAVEAVPLAPLMKRLRGFGLRLGVATNDAVAPARGHLEGAGVLDLFDLVLGSDSGHGGKPETGQLTAFASAFGLPPARVAMVGDSLHDLVAARSAGMAAIAVLTGPATVRDLAPHADTVLPDIGHLPAWLGRPAR